MVFPLTIKHLEFRDLRLDQLQEGNTPAEVHEIAPVARFIFDLNSHQA